MTVMTRLSAASKQTPLLKSITLAMSLGALADVDFVVAVRVVGAIFFAEADTMIVADWGDGGMVGFTRCNLRQRLGSRHKLSD